MFTEIAIKRPRNHEYIENTCKMIDKPVTFTYQLTRNFTLNPILLVEMSHRYPLSSLNTSYAKRLRPKQLGLEIEIDLYQTNDQISMDMG